MARENEEPKRPCPACSVTDSNIVGDKSGFQILVCKSCKSLYTSRLPSGSEVEDYDEYYGAENLSVPKFIHRRAEQIVGSFASYRSLNRILDVGFGSGTILDAARKLNWEAWGQEVSKPAAELARMRGFDVFHGELEDAKFPDEHFDVATASEIIEHLPDPQKTLREIARILRPGGLLWATTPSARSLSYRLMKESWTILSPPEHTQLYSKKGIGLILRQTGFTDINIQTVGLNPSELISYYRAGRMTPHEFDRVSTSYELNEKMTSSTTGKIIKSFANVVLNALQLGDSLKIFARKAGA